MLLRSLRSLCTVAATLSLALLATLAAPAARLEAQVLNEVVANHTGTDTAAFVEVLGAPSTDYTATLKILEIEGDAAPSATGTIDYVWTPGMTNGTGHWASSLTPVPHDIENGTVTLLLVAGFSGDVLDDLDTNDDGTLDVTPWTTLLDAVAITDGGAGDRTYAAFALAAGYDGNAFVPGGASRMPDGTDTNTAADWMRNDFDGAGLPGLPGGWTPGEAYNTPGTTNADVAPALVAARLNEFVLDHTGSDTDELVEVYGQISASFAGTWVVVLDCDAAGDPGHVDLALEVGMTNGSGLWRTASLGAGAIGNVSKTLLLVSAWSGSLGADLDTDDDGTLDATPWTALLDSVAVADGAGTDVFYSAVVLTSGFDGLPGVVGGTSRRANGVDTDTTADWVRNDFDGAGLLSASDATLGADEAWNTPAMANRVRLADVWQDVSLPDATTARATIHAAIDDHIRHAYSSSDADTWTILELADEAPGDATSILDIYRNEIFAKFGGGTGPYNREHTWPNSWGFPDDGLDNSAYTDCHHLMLSHVGYNSDRSNLPYGTCNAGCSEDATLLNYGVGGGSGIYPGNSNWFTGSSNTGTFETWNGRRGDVARALLYLDVRYEGGTHGATGFAEPDLRLTDNTGLIVSTGANQATAYMGRLTTLLAWHAADPPDAKELARNDAVWLYQGNRNPFIDHPEWVACVFLGECDLFEDGFETGDTSLWSARLP